MISQLFITIGYIIFFISRFKKRKKYILITDNISRCCFIIGYILLNSINGIEHTIYGIFRNFVGQIMDKKKRVCKILVFIIMIFILIVMYVLSFTGFSTILFIISGIINLFTVFFMKEQGIRLGTAFAAICNIIAFFLLQSNASIIGESLCGIIGIVSFIKEYKS